MAAIVISPVLFWLVAAGICLLWHSVGGESEFWFSLCGHDGLLVGLFLPLLFYTALLLLLPLLISLVVDWLRPPAGGVE
jgi:hypothetical protein